MTSTKKTNEQCILAQLILHEPIKYLASAKAQGKMLWVCRPYFCSKGNSETTPQSWHNAVYGQCSWMGQEGRGGTMVKDVPCIFLPAPSAQEMRFMGSPLLG